jgi:hypothetical protein
VLRDRTARVLLGQGAGEICTSKILWYSMEGGRKRRLVRGVYYATVPLSRASTAQLDLCDVSDVGLSAFVTIVLG